MNTRILKVAGILVMFVLLIVVSGCYAGDRVGELRSESETVELDDAELVQVEIDIGAGELNVTGGAAELMEADFTYNVEEIDPQVTYSGGNLTVRQSETKTGIATLFDLDDYRNEWDLRFNEDAHMEMSIDLGAGRTDLALGSLALTRLNIDAGAGEVDVDLGGSQLLTVLDFDMGAGEVTFDLTGDWQNDLEATINGGIGALTLRLPKEVGVRVEVDSGIGSVDANGLSKDGDAYVNDAYGESDVTLRIEVDAGVGQINLIVE